MALGTAFFAQAPTTEKKVHVVVKTDNNGVITNMDTTISLDNMEDAQKVLQEMGIDANIQLDSDVKGVRVMKFEVDVDEEIDGNGDVNVWMDKDGERMEMKHIKHVEKFDGNIEELLEGMEGLDDEKRAEIQKMLEQAELMEGDVKGEMKVIRIESNEDSDADGEHPRVMMIRTEKNSESFDGNIEELLEGMEGLDDEKRAVIQKLLEQAEQTKGDKNANVKVIRIEGDMEGDDKHPRVMMFRTDKDGEGVDIDSDVEVKVHRLKDGDDIHIMKEIRIMIRLTEINDEDKVALKRAGAPVAPSIAESLQLEELAFYPNPNDGRFRLQFNAPDEGDVTVRVVNMQGKALYTKKLPGFSGRYDEMISLGDQVAGTYLLSISQNGQTVNKKLVKQ